MTLNKSGETEKSMIIVRIWEGIGNQLFQYAYARSQLKKNKCVFLDLDKAYKEKFPTLRNNSIRENSIQKFNITVPSIDVEKLEKYSYLERKTWMEQKIFYLAQNGWWPYSFIEEKSEHYSRRIDKLKRNVYIKGWFQDIRYFKDIRKELLQELTPKKKIKIPLYLLNMIKDKNSVAIHVRRGDYVRLGRALPVAYYISAKKMIETKIKSPIYLIFSDDYKWVKENINWNCKVFYIDELCDLEDYEQLFIMSRCRSQVISNSTFSWWAAWLNSHKDKIIIAPKQFIQHNPGLKIRNSILI